MSLHEAENRLSQSPLGWNPQRLQEHLKSVRVVVLRTRWYPELMQALTESAENYLTQWGVPRSNIIIQEVPGSFELPLAAEWAFSAKLASLGSQKPDFVIALGCVVRGDTPHFDYVCQAATQGLLQVHLKYSKPLGFGVLTVNSMEQALLRKNKGAEAAQACIEMHLSSFETAKN